jgi:hypothetical protein
MFNHYAIISTASEEQINLVKGIISQMAFKKSFQPTQYNNYGKIT